MTSITTFGYGITVQVPELITASRAWPALEPVFKFFDLLFLRRKQGTLESRVGGDDVKRSVLEKVPVEVWEEVRQWTVVSQMEEEEDKLLRPFAGFCCDSSDVSEGECNCQEPRNKKLGWEKLSQGIPPCFTEESLRCDDEYISLLHDFTVGRANVLGPFHRLVAAFGLAHPLPRTITLDPDDWFNLDDIAFISIPFEAERSGSSHSTISAEAGYDNQDEQTIVDVSFDLPPDADSRFLRFVRTFNLRIVEVSNGSFKSVPPNPRAKPELRSNLAGIGKGRTKIVKEIRPRWKLYSSCHCDW
ncbi:hypothetical protein JCM5350_002752 [Sporobolomyces pararoseus]